jgi:hypothetical protein
MRKIALLLTVLLATACVSTNAVRLANAGTYPEVPPEQVQVFLTETDVKVEFEKIALINASGESNWTNEEGMIKAMQKKAGKLGANGIILGDIKEASAGAKVAAAVFGTGTQRKGQVVAIRLKEAAKQ